MNPNILHVGLDVGDTRYHGSAFNRETGTEGDLPTAIPPRWEHTQLFNSTPFRRTLQRPMLLI